MTLNELREAFLHAGHRTYLNHAATAPLSRPVREALEAAGVDVLAAGTHKWLMGTQGLGLLYLRDGLLQRLRPPMAGWAHGPIDWDRLFEYELLRISPTYYNTREEITRLLEGLEAHDRTGR